MRQSHQNTAIAPLVGLRTLLYAVCGLLLGAGLTLGGYLVDYHATYGGLPETWSPSALRGLHDATPMHSFAGFFALILALAGGLAGWFQDRLVFYSNRLEEQMRIRTQDLLRIEERYAVAVEGSHDGLWDWDLQTNEVDYSARWKRMIGSADDDLGESPEVWLGRLHPEDEARVREEIEAHVLGATPCIHVEYRMRHASGGYRWMLARGVTVRDVEQVPTRLAGSQTDVHDRRQAEDQLRHLAVHDPLTDLPNRTLLLDRMGRILKRASRRSTRVAVLHIGVDRFKKINESLGHEVADRLLVKIGKRLSAVVRELEESEASRNRELTGTVFRAEGDEFVVVFEEIRSLRAATRKAERILQTHEGPLHVDGREVLLGLSVGIAVGPRGYSDAAKILRDAQTAMHRAKVQGRARFEVFDREMLHTAEATMHLETELYQAVEGGQLRLWYQPILALTSRRIVGFEALVRWEHPERGMVSPGEFIPLAEETGQIVRMSQWLFEEAFVQLREWQDMFPRRSGLSINMNLSPSYLFHPELESDLGSLIKKTGADPERVHLEVTESSFIDRPEAAAEVLDRLKAWGFMIALDDFGTGFSSLSLLHELPFDILKIDRQFVSKMGRDHDVRKIVGTVIDLARKLGLDAVAEGIETPAQLRELRSMRCKYGQGYLLGRPLSADRAERLIRNGRKGRRRLPAKAS